MEPQKKRKVLLGVSLLAAGATVVALIFFREREPRVVSLSEWAKLHPVERKPLPESRCTPRKSKSLRLVVGGELRWEKSNERLFEEISTRSVAKREGGREREYLDLVSLLTEPNAVVEVIPCVGEFVILESTEEIAAHSLFLNRRGTLKLLRFNQGGGREERVSNLYEISVK